MTQTQGTESQRGGFFMVDRRAWAAVCELGLNEAVAYLMLARGTGPDNRTTSWSVDAIERHTGIARPRAKAAIQNLIDRGMIDRTQGGTHPKYVIKPAHELPGWERPKLDWFEQRTAEAAVRGDYIKKGEQRYLEAAIGKGWLQRSAGKYVVAPEPNTDPDWIWLPNALVTGAVAEPPPVERVRQTRDVMTLRLLVDMYHAQNLAADGGIDRRAFYKKFDRLEVGQQGAYTVWGFYASNSLVMWGHPLSDPHKRDKLTDQEKAEGKDIEDVRGSDWFRRVDALRTLGLFEWVPHLFEGDDATAEPIHPCGMGLTNSLEDQIGEAAYLAGARMVTPAQHDRARAVANGGKVWLAPVQHHLSQVRMIGVARLRYRARTKNTAAWWAQHQQDSQTWIARYAALGNSGAASTAA